MVNIYINTVLAGMLFYTCFCRLVRTSTDTVMPVRLAFCVLAAASALCGAAPFLTGMVPQWPQLVIEAAMAVVQALTAQYWRDGVPCHFQRHTARPEGWEATSWM
jgi:hypothetical protein